MDKIQEIRDRFYKKGENISQIAEAFGLDWRTVQKYVDKEDFNEKPPKPADEKHFCPKLDKYKGVIDDWLINDKGVPRKQRHTAKRVFTRLKEAHPDFHCSYRTVAIYYAQKHKEIFNGYKESFIPLVHYPGECQVDFGTAVFYENGFYVEGKYLEVSFPYSNKGYLQLFYGENMECLLEGLDAIFRQIGKVPNEVLFDNTRTIVTKILKNGGRDLTQRFERFKEHYRFNAKFTNVNKGNEKGNCENKVGYHRRNFLVPVPQFTYLSEFNVKLLELCENDAQREHYRHNKSIQELFEEDKAHCHTIPNIEFDLSGKAHAITDKWGKFYLNKNLHTYSSSPKCANKRVEIRLTSSHVIVLDENFREIVRHKRLYGDKKQESMNWIPYLKLISIRPRSLKNTGIYDIMPEKMKNFLERCSNTEIGKVLKVLAELTEKSSFEAALTTVNEALNHQISDADNLKSLHIRLHNNLPELPPMSASLEVPSVKEIKSDVDSYDLFLNMSKGV